MTVDWSDEELDEVAGELLAAAPAVDPPAGFEDRVLERIRGAGEQQNPARRSWWPTAVAAAVFLLLGLVGGLALGRSSDDSSEAIRTVELVSASGTGIGDVSTFPGNQPWIFMRVEAGVADGTYRCTLEMDDGSVVQIGKLWVLNGHGGWGEHVDVDLDRARFARVLDREGATVASARFS